MDALVFLAGSAPPTWTIDERDAHGKHLGKIVQRGHNWFFIVAEAAPLIGVKAGPYPDLGAAMRAVAMQIKGTCERWQR